MQDATRRQFLRHSAALTSSLFLPTLPGVALAARELPLDLGFNLKEGIRKLDLYRPASKERLALEYLHDGVWAQNAYPQICWMLRDVQAARYVRMAPTLIAILDWTQHYLRLYGYNQPLHILSGFRTVHTNQNTEGAVRNSQHLYGKAVDFHIPGLPTEYLGNLMAWLSQGGVGVYARHGFVHVDTGRVRHWRGR